MCGIMMRAWDYSTIGVPVEICKMGIHTPAETCTAPTIITLWRVIPPIPTLQALSSVRLGNLDAPYTCTDGYHQLTVRPKKRGQEQKGPHREKSINHSSNDLHEPFQRDLVALPSLVPDLYLAFPQFVPGPL